MGMKRNLTALFGLTLLAASFTAYAADIKVGLIDLPQILQESSQVQTVNKQLQNEFKPRQEQIIAEQHRIRAEAQKLSPDQSKNLTKEEKDATEKKLMADQKQLQEMVVKFQRDLNQAQTTAMKSFITEINNTVKSVAQADKLQLVLLKPAVVYAEDAQDITKQVLEKLPKGS